MSGNNDVKQPQTFDMKKIQAMASKYAIYLVLVVLFLAIGALNNNFFSSANVINILNIASIRIIIALGVGGILITRGTDLSAGRSVGLTACIAASLLQRPDYVVGVLRNYEADPSRIPIAVKFYQFFQNIFNGIGGVSSSAIASDPAANVLIPVLFAILIAMIAGLCIGIFNGAVVALLQVPPFIATLGTQVIVYGLACLYTDAQPIGGLRDDFTSLASGSTLFIPNLILISVLVIGIIYFLHNQSRFGKYIFAIGGNPNAATVSGVNVTLTLIKTYALAGLLYGLAGALLAARTGGATNNYALSYELDAIAASTIGGVSTAGGIGTVPGIITGVLIFEVLTNGFAVLGVNPYWQQVIKGVIIIGAVAFDIRKYLAKK